MTFHRQNTKINSHENKYVSSPSVTVLKLSDIAFYTLYALQYYSKAWWPLMVVSSLQFLYYKVESVIWPYRNIHFS